MEIAYFNKAIETISRYDLEHLQLERLRRSVDAALQTSFYKNRLTKAGIVSSADIKTCADLQRIPFTTKDDLRQSYPRGLLAVPMDDVVRLHTSSGTTGTPTVIYHTQEDINTWAELLCRCIVSTGCHRGDMFQNMTGYGMFTGGLGFHYGAERVGMTVIPAGSGNTRRQIQLMKDFHTTVIHATPSYILHIYSLLADCGITIQDLSLKKAFLGAEPYSENTRKKIEELFQIEAYNSYGLSEMNGPGVAFECVYKDGMHTWEDSFLLEIIDPQTGELLKDGETGELVFTTLCRKATPLLRYRTRDLSSVVPGTCPCGRTHRRISRITGRSDDMLIVNGVNIFPSQIEEVIMRIPEVGTNYQVHLDKEGALDTLTVKVEIYSKMFSGEVNELDRLKSRIHSELRASIIVNPRIELHEPGSLPVSEGKAQRVVDKRPKL
ncbi:MAG TPA: phenylacetate--CoA ligase [Candidatus Omnitrophota bacterium]|nr:phenylacetate--CoA ligase [Candidatus Omnitrophota bacterium]HPT08026.1 phenylacetate--CoA ligase [Candidatus Omnitrophota bacterium]